ncbi:MAG: DUF3662 domain-containing protein, partial [Anaerolineae bacterium]|nr:DUF3662 domain-containing protein [Anaerolineae bacterium]
MQPPYSLRNLEAQLARLIEGSFARLFDGRLYPHEVASRLARALEENLYRQPDGSLRAPDQFIVRLNAQDCAALLAEQPDLPDRLALSLVETAHSANLLLRRMPQVHLLPEQAFPAHSLQVQAFHGEEDATSTELLALSDLP